MSMRSSAGSPAGGEATARVLRHSGWLAGAYAFAFGLALLQNVVLARNLDPSDFGVLALVIAVVTFVQLLLGSRVWEAATTFVVEFRGRGDGARATATVKLCYLVDALGAVVGFLLLTVTAEPIARTFSAEAAAAPIRLFALSMLVAIPIATSTALLRVGDRFRWLSAQTVGENLVRLGAVVCVLIVFGASLMPIVGAYIAAVAFSATTLWWLARRIRGELGLVRWRDAPLSLLAEDRRKILAFLLNSNLAGTARVVTGRVDVLIVGWLTDPASVGVYRLARSVSDPLAAVATPVSQAVFPEISRLVQAGDGQAIRALTLRIRRLAIEVVVPVCVATVLLAGWLVPLVFGPAYEEAVPLIRIMVWQLVWLPYVWLPALLLSLRRSGALATFTAIDAGVYLALLLLLVPPLGVGGAAWATLMRFVVWTFAAAVIAKRLDLDLEARPA